MATLILKPTEVCNAACAYCEVDRKGYRLTKRMPLEILELLFIRLNEFLMKRKGEKLEIIWHGGEPLLLGERYFRKALEFQQRHCAATVHQIRHTVQSNMTLFTPEFIEVFRKLGISSVGTSYDPVEGVRMLKGKQDSTEYNRRFMNGVRLFEKEGLGWGVIYVVTQLALEKALDIFYFMTNLAPEGRVMFNPVTVENLEHQYLKISGSEFNDFLGAIFPVWWKHKRRYPNVEPFRSLTRGILSGGKEVFFCADSGNCSNTHFNLGPEGKWSHCGRSADWGLLDYGTIFDRSIEQVFSNPERNELRRRNDVLSNGECRRCAYWSICHGGCPLDGYLNTGFLMSKTTWCPGKKDFIERYFRPVTGLAHKSTIAG